MSTHDKIDLPPPAGHYYEWDGVYGKRKFTTAPHNGRECDRAVAYYTADQVRAAIEADRKRRQSEAEEVCAEAYQVVGSLLSDLGIFETEHAEKILDNLSQARMVHKDVLPWHSHDRKRRSEPVKVPRLYQHTDGRYGLSFGPAKFAQGEPAWYAVPIDVYEDEGR